jgi:hypothetical protein
LPLLATHLSGKFSNSPAPTAASKSESLLEGITLLAHLQSKAAWALQKDSQARQMSKENTWQNPYVERLIGTLRRECLPHPDLWRTAFATDSEFVFALLQ